MHSLYVSYSLLMKFVTNEDSVFSNLLGTISQDDLNSD